MNPIENLLDLYLLFSGYYSLKTYTVAQKADIVLYPLQITDRMFPQWTQGSSTSHVCCSEFNTAMHGS